MFDHLKDHRREPPRGILMECLESYLKKLLENLLKPYLNKPAVEASEELLMERLKEPLEKLFEELPKEFRERPHRPCKWL
jgi:hypothetical protein